jgi:hypothetical protein
MAATQKSAVKPTRAPRWPQGLVPWRKSVERFLEKVAKASGLQIEILGARRTQTGPDGTVSFELEPGGGGGAACEYAWTPVFVENDGAGNDIVTLNVGTLFGATVTIADVVTETDVNILADPAPQLAIPDDDLYIGYIEVTGTKTKTANDFVTGFTISSATVEVATSVPASTATVRRLELWRWSNGALFSQARKYNLRLVVSDDGTSTDVGDYEFKVSA